MLKTAFFFTGFWLYALQSQGFAKIYGTYENVGTAPASIRQLPAVSTPVVLAPGSRVDTIPPFFYHEVKGFQHEIQLPKGGSIVLKDLEKPCDGGKLISIERRGNAGSDSSFETSFSSECINCKEDALHFRAMIQNEDIRLIAHLP